MLSETQGQTDDIFLMVRGRNDSYSKNFKKTWNVSVYIIFCALLVWGHYFLYTGWSKSAYNKL